jgi:hypothetical protein
VEVIAKKLSEIPIDKGESVHFAQKTARKWEKITNFRLSCTIYQKVIHSPEGSFFKK